MISTHKQLYGMKSPPAQYEYTQPVEFTKKDSLKFEDEESLFAAFREQIRNGRELEEAKIKLASFDDFNLMDAF